jgi:hypothetical protein
MALQADVAEGTSHVLKPDHDCANDGQGHNGEPDPYTFRPRAFVQAAVEADKAAHVEFSSGAMRTSSGSTQTFLAEWFVVRFPRATYRRACELPHVRRPRSREVLAAFAAHKDEVTAGYVKAAKRG